MKATELRDKTIEELEKMAVELAEEIRAVETAVRMHTYTRTSELGVLKKSRARMLTVLSNKRTITHS